MLALRALTRSAPRSTARLTTASLRPSIFPSTPIRQIIPRQTLAATFTTTRPRRDEHAQHLAAKLDSEISVEHAEAATHAGSDSNLDAFRGETDWDFSGDVAGSQDVFLTKQYEDETVTVHFSIADFNNLMSEGEEEDMDPAMEDEDFEGQSGGANSKGAINQGRTGGGNFKQMPEDSIAPADREELADEEDQPPPYPIAVSVLIQRPSAPTKGALKFLLTAAESNLTIEQLIHLPAEASTGDAHALLRENPEHLYAGPPFQQLDEEVQSILESYLSARGITSELAAVIPDYVDVKEQREYLGWLGRVKEFVE